MKTIGIKLADGSFFPVMEEGSVQSKKLELTTANNNQTCVMVDLYRSETGSMNDAEYIDTLRMENLVEHPNGEPSLSFSLNLDENNQLTANIRDPETGATSDSSIPLVKRTQEELANTDEYTIEESAPETFDLDETQALDDNDMDFTFPEETSPAADNFSTDDFTVDTNDTTQSENKGPISFEGLYDKETVMGEAAYHEETTTKKSRISVWICILCAAICILATVILLVLIPIKCKNKVQSEPSSNQIDITKLEKEENKTTVELPKVPAAKENEIVVIKEAEKVIPSPASKKAGSNVKYKLKWGDTLWDIANTYYKNPWKYKKIANYNNIKNPDHIISGTIIVIPAE